MLDQFKTALDNALIASHDWQNLKKAWCEDRFPISALGIRGAMGAVVLAHLAEFTEDSILVITPDDSAAQNLLNDLSLFTEKTALFPWWGTMLYRGVSPQAAIFGKRAAVLADLAFGRQQIVVAPLRAALGLLPPPSIIRKNSIQIKLNDSLDTTKTNNDLVRLGYNRVPHVSVPGEFSLRGEVLDVYPPGNYYAFRVVFSWDKIEELRIFNPLTQASEGKLESLILHPIREFIWDDNSIEHLLDYMEEDESRNDVLDSLVSHNTFRGEELFYPLFCNKPVTLQEYLGEKGTTVFLSYNDLDAKEIVMHKEYAGLYNRALTEKMFVPEPRLLTTNLGKLRSHKRCMTCYKFKSEDQTFDCHITSSPGRSFFGNMELLRKEMVTLLEKNYKVFVFAESDTQSRRIAYMLRDIEGLLVGSAVLSEGFELPEAGILALQENEIFGRRKKGSDSLRHTRSEAIETFVDLNPGDYVVHVNYGIGLFKGIQRIAAAGSERDYIELAYASEETVFIPIEQVNMVQRYIGQEGRVPRLDKLGGSSWERKKNSAKKAVADLADRLIGLYARRQIAIGFAFPKDDEFQISFEASFPWQETPDQLIAIEDVKADMESPRPMDRLICGDVGYGKTEIAMRAAFKSVMGGRQTVVLSPTTILTEQHYETFTERFSRFPVSIAMLSRFVSTRERKKILADVANGDIDIIIGTHRILSKDVSFKNLGLLIIDEEQRFGVKHKERLKELKTSVDCLTLSATPIPRTLHMSLLKIRDMSLLVTPPPNRQPIETFIQKYNDEAVAEAIRREVRRDGQVYFLHNRIDDLDQVTAKLRQLVPEVFIESVHGQMAARMLEDIMHRFIHGAFQVLVSTTIIENGIDIPNVNTIIIDKANMYGISQLYQLRGRVGRSGRLAYAYLFYPDNRELTELAARRLEIISDFTELGSGFKIAMKDIEVRGVGNLLGVKQTGDVYTVGFDLYLKLLEDAIRERRDKDEKDEKDEKSEIYLELDYSGYIPNTYITEASEKMEVYKKIAAVTDYTNLQRLQTELNDRYGPLPDEVHSLLSIAEIRIICSRLRIVSLKERKGQVQISFGRVSLIPVDKVIQLINSSERKVKLDSKRPDTLLMDTGNISLKEKSLYIQERLETLLENDVTP